MDAALEAYRRTSTESNLAAVLERVHDAAPLFPLFYGATIIVHAWRLANVELSATGMPLLADVTVDR